MVGGNYSVGTEMVFNENMVGTAKVLINETFVEIEFSEEYPVAPIVTLTVVGLPNFFYGVDEITISGFKILISDAQAKEVVFNWHAFGQEVEEVNWSEISNVSVDENVTLETNGTMKINISIPDNETIVVNETEVILPENKTEVDNNVNDGEGALVAEEGLDNEQDQNITPVKEPLVENISAEISEINNLSEVVEIQDDSNNLTEEELQLLNSS